MPGTRRRLLAIALAISFASFPAFGDDKDLLKGSTIAAPPNLYIVFGNTQTMTQTLTFTGSNFSTFDGDADSPGSKLGAAKRVIRDFLAQRHGSFNIGMTAFSRPPNTGSTSISRKHWIYAPLAVDFPSETWREPIGTLERWGTSGAGPCTSKTVPVCSDRSPVLVLPTSSQANTQGPFFGAPPPGTASTTCGSGGTACINITNSARIRVRLTSGRYGDAFTDGTLTAYTLGDHSVNVTKEYQTRSGSTWTTQATTPNGSPGTVVIPYVPLGSPIPAGSGSPDATLFYPTGATNSSGSSIAGKSVGFLQEEPSSDFSMNTNCSGLEFQNTGHPLIKIPRDYSIPDPANPNVCLPALDSYLCAKRLLRPQAYIENYDPSSGFTTNDPDNPGYTQTGSKYADGCDPSLMGTAQDGLDDVERQVILTAKNGSQAPIKGALQNILDYFTDPKIDGFKNGVRGDDPNAGCRGGAVILIYDTFNGCQNDSCSFLTSKFLTTFKQLGIPIYVIGFGMNAQATATTGVCIAHNSGAILPDGTDGYFPVTTGLQLAEALNNIADFVLESQKGFVAASVSTAQLAGEQMIYLATFNAASQRSIWDGRVNGYHLDPNGKLKIGVHTIRDTNDPFNNVAATVPSNDPTSLKWNAGQNLAQTDGTGATNPSAVLAPNAAKLANGSYQDNSNDTASTIATHRYPGRKLVFSLPQGYTDPPTTLPLPPGNSSPEVRSDMTASTGASWWPALKALLGPQTEHPGVPAPLDDTDATESLRFIWGDRDAVMALPAGTPITKKYTPAAGSQLKLGDIFHSNPILVGGSERVPLLLEQSERLSDVPRHVPPAPPGPLLRRERRPLPRVGRRRVEPDPLGVRQPRRIAGKLLRLGHRSGAVRFRAARHHATVQNAEGRRGAAVEAGRVDGGRRPDRRGRLHRYGEHRRRGNTGRAGLAHGHRWRSAGRVALRGDLRRRADGFAGELLRTRRDAAGPARP